MSIAAGKTYLQVDALCKSYHRGLRNQKQVLQDISLVLNQGEILGLLGPNGAGKTTLFAALIGMLSVDSGEIKIGDHLINDVPLNRRHKYGLGYLPQESSVFGQLSCLENVVAMLEIRGIYGRQAQNLGMEQLEQVGMAQMANSRASTLSGGERRRIEIARMLVINPKFILLDEPFAALDPIIVEGIKKLLFELRNQQIGILINDHNYKELLDLCDSLYLLHNGKIVTSGKPDVVMSNELARKYYFGERG